MKLRCLTLYEGTCPPETEEPERYDRSSNEALESLERLAYLEELTFYCTNVTEVGLDHVKGLHKLRELTIVKLPSNTRITDTALEHLGELRELRSLRLIRTGVTDDGVRELQQALPECKILYVK